MHDEPLASAEAKEEEALAKMTKEERQKYRKKQKQAAERAEREAAERKAAEDAAAKKAADGKKKPAQPKKPDPDPLGETLAATKTPLDDADKILAKLIAHASAREETHLLTYQIRRRQGRLVDAMRAVEAASKATPGSFLARRDAVELAAIVAAGGEALAGVSAEDRDACKRASPRSSGEDGEGGGGGDAGGGEETRGVRGGGGAAIRRVGRRRPASPRRAADVDGATAKECIAAMETFEAIDEAAAAEFERARGSRFPGAPRSRLTNASDEGVYEPGAAPRRRFETENTKIVEAKSFISLLRCSPRDGESRALSSLRSRAARRLASRHLARSAASLSVKSSSLAATGAPGARLCSPPGAPPRTPGRVRPPPLS